MDTESRLVPLQGSFNFRDLGGYPGRGGRLTRWGRLYRADALHELTAADVAHLRHLGLRTIVDLRTERELARSGRGPLEPEGVAFHHLAVVQEGVRGDGTSDRAAVGEAVAAPAPAGDDLAERYLWYLDVGRASLVEALTMEGFLDQLQIRYGGAREWALDAGIPAEVLDRMDDLLLEPGA